MLLLAEHHLEFLSLKKAAEASPSLQLSNAKLLEISCRGSNVTLNLHQRIWWQLNCLCSLCSLSSALKVTFVLILLIRILTTTITGRKMLNIYDWKSSGSAAAAASE